MNPKYYAYVEARDELEIAQQYIEPVHKKMEEASSRDTEYEPSAAENLLIQRLVSAHKKFREAYINYYGVEPPKY